MDIPNLYRTRQFVQFSAYGFLKNLRFFDAFLMIFLVGKHLDFTAIGSLYAARELAGYVLEVPSGLMADQLGRKRSLLCSFGLYMISFLLFHQAESFWALLAGMLLFGTADAFRSGTHKGMIMTWLAHHGSLDQKVAFYGRTRSWSQMGSSVSALLAGILIFYDGQYDRIFLYSMIPYGLNLINVWSYPPTLDMGSKKSRRPGFRVVWNRYLDVIRNIRLLRIVHSAAAHSAFTKSLKDYLQPILLQLSFGIPILLDYSLEKKSGLIIGITYFVIYQLSSLASRRADLFRDLHKIGPRSLFLGLCAGLLYGMMILMELYWAALLPVVIVYVIENIRKPILTGEVADEVPDDILTSVLSTQSFWKTMLTAGMSLMLGVLIDWQGIGAGIVMGTATLLMVTFALERKIFFR